MLANKEAVGTIAVKDLAVARKFYEGTLGLRVVNSEGEEALTLASGSSKVIVYRSQFAGTNKATAMNWLVGAEIENIARGLRERGVVFERYDMPGATYQDGLHVFGDFKTGWFKDPDGNILCIMNR